MHNQSLADLARTGPIEYSHLHALLRGDHEPSPRLRRRLCERWDATFDELFSIIEEPAGAVA